MLEPVEAINQAKCAVDHSWRTTMVGAATFFFTFAFAALTTNKATATMASCANEAYVLAPDGRTFCEQHFYVENSCNGQDQLAIVETPWEQKQISIRGVTIAFMSKGLSSGYVYSGNSFNHDIMAWLDPVREGVVRQWFPDGLSFQFPGLLQETASARSRVDLHVSCAPAGTAYSTYLIVYYTIP